MFTKEHLFAEVPNEFSLEELAAILNKPHSTAADARFSSPPASLTPAQAAEWTYYTSPEAKALYARFSASPALLALRGVASQLPADDLHKTAKDWEAEL